MTKKWEDTKVAQAFLASQIVEAKIHNIESGLVITVMFRIVLIAVVLVSIYECLQYRARESLLLFFCFRDEARRQGCSHEVLD